METNMPSLAHTLSDTETFRGWSTDAIEALVERCEYRAFEPGEPLWQEGDEANSTFILIEGALQRTKRAYPDGDRTQGIDEPGQILSPSSLVNQEPHTSSCVPTTRVEVLELKDEAFHEMFALSHPAAFYLTDLIAEDVVDQLRDTNRRLHQVFGQPADTLRMLRQRMREA